MLKLMKTFIIFFTFANDISNKNLYDSWNSLIYLSLFIALFFFGPIFPMDLNFRNCVYNCLLFVIVLWTSTVYRSFALCIEIVKAHTTPINDMLVNLIKCVRVIDQEKSFNYNSLLVERKADKYLLDHVSWCQNLIFFLTIRFDCHYEGFICELLLFNIFKMVN